jgi:hypothetical protein
MKKPIIILLCALAFASCKKNYTCECTTTSNFPGYTPTTANTTINDREKRAEELCKAKNSSGGAYGFTLTSTCTLK